MKMWVKVFLLLILFPSALFAQHLFDEIEDDMQELTQEEYRAKKKYLNGLVEPDPSYEHPPTYHETQPGECHAYEEEHWYESTVNNCNTDGYIYITLTHLTFKQKTKKKIIITDVGRIFQFYCDKSTSTYSYQYKFACAPVSEFSIDD